MSSLIVIRFRSCLTGVLLVALCAVPGRSDEIVMKNGLTLKGKVVRTAGLDAKTIGQNNNADVKASAFWLCDDGVRRYFVFRLLAPDVVQSDLGRGLTFELEHERRSDRGIPTVIGLFEKTEFDKFGRRMIELTTVRGAEPIQQAIAEVRPEFLKVESTTHKWEMGLDVTALPTDTLRAIIGQAIDSQNADERKAVVLYFIRIGKYAQARDEIESIAADFPEQAAWAEERRVDVQHLNALNALQEVRRREEAGQYALALKVARAFPADRVSADVLREARDIVTRLDDAQHKLEHVGMQLDLLQAEVDSDMLQRLAPLRAALLSELHPDSLPRLEPFLRVEPDAAVPASEKLALAYSGWVVGSANAVTSLDEAIRLWDARFLVLEYLRSGPDEARHQELVEELLRIDGVSLARIQQIIELLPPPLAEPTAAAGVPAEFEVIDIYDQVQQTYSVILPPEYSPHHVYPLLVVLHAGGMAPTQELALWAGTADQPGPAQARGYITIAPHFAADGDTTYNYDVESHDCVLHCINDARRRFRIDSDRVYLAGHGMGADACFDIGMTNPGIFAGVVPINGISDRYCMHYRLNDPLQSWYVVNGELHGDQRGLAITRNALDLNQMMRAQHDMVYCEFKQRGFETYFEEFPKIFEWMALHRRAPQPRELGNQRRNDPGISILRPSDTRFHWLTISGLPAKLSEPILWESKRPRAPRPLTISGKLAQGNEMNTFYINHPGSHSTIWLSPEMVNFEQRIKIEDDGTKFFDYVRPDIGVMLEDLRVRGDRQRMYLGKIVI